MHAMQTSQGYIFHILQHFATKLCSFTNFEMLFNAAVMNYTISNFLKILPIIGNWSIGYQIFRSPICFCLQVRLHNITESYHTRERDCIIKSKRSNKTYLVRVSRAYSTVFFS